MIRRAAAAPLKAASPEKNGIEHATEPDGRLRMPFQSATLPPFFLTLLAGTWRPPTSGFHIGT